MNIRLLRVFQAVCATGNITKAAENLHMTQPAVSQAIRDLEREAGLVLFDRLGRRIYITEAGRIYLDKVQPLLELCDTLAAGTAKIQETAAIRIGSCLTIAEYWLPQIQSAFNAGYDTPVKATIAGAWQVFTLLQKNLIDLALYEGPAPASPYISQIFSSYQLIPVCAKNHPFAGQIVSLTDFLAQPLLLREPGSAVRDVLDSFLRLKGLEAQPMMTSTDSQALIQLLKANLGVGILPDKIIPPSPDESGLAIFTVAGMKLQNDNRIVYHQDKYLSPAMAAYLDIVLTAGQHTSPLQS